AEPVDDVGDLLGHGLILAELEEVRAARGGVGTVGLAPVELRVRGGLHELVVDAVHERTVLFGLRPLLRALGIGAPRPGLLGTLFPALPGPDVDDLVALLTHEGCPEPDEAEAEVLPLLDGEATEAVEEGGQPAGGHIVAAQ